MGGEIKFRDVKACVFSGRIGRKWLTTPVRKLSQGKFDRNSSASNTSSCSGATAAPASGDRGSGGGVGGGLADKPPKGGKNERKTGGKLAALKVGVLKCVCVFVKLLAYCRADSSCMQ